MKKKRKIINAFDNKCLKKTYEKLDDSKINK